ncbi:hypothetical protein PRIPAC_96724 [Pristionchus pacificus]|uniref:Uncharacterized protein n=1 Tax=Pristionchus pacificus TaxID=54126 RepID=A0A2A6D1Q2_PRIPA|nr:hypothetical protein PRIPAC_96724 [Pristionchus pacificus]|eukprot:PDM84374.1 hypothetical protein PRIPAC_33397 [Pristionchus pacificus]
MVANFEDELRGSNEDGKKNEEVEKRREHSCTASLNRQETSLSPPFLSFREGVTPCQLSRSIRGVSLLGSGLGLLSEEGIGPISAHVTVSPECTPVVLDTTKSDESSIARRAPVHLVPTGVVLPVYSGERIGANTRCARKEEAPDSCYLMMLYLVTNMASGARSAVVTTGCPGIAFATPLMIGFDVTV